MSYTQFTVFNFCLSYGKLQHKKKLLYFNFVFLSAYDQISKVLVDKYFPILKEKKSKISF